jgi:ubiquinone/menaquinone biosynthesis C-methylase UbiE
MTDDTHNRYNDPQIVSYYERLADLQICEQVAFNKYVRAGAAVLDIGVGGGRTSAHLANGAKIYIGVDYAEAMVEAARRRFPNLEFAVADATAMPQFGDASFDVAVFSFNGIDLIGDDAGRVACFQEVARILEPGGIFIFSSHNARVLGEWPQLRDATGYRIPWRIVRSIFTSAALARRTLMSGCFSAGHGYIYDPTHGGINTYTSTPAVMRPQIEAAGFTVVDVIAGVDPRTPSPYLTAWYYYVCQKPMK